MVELRSPSDSLQMLQDKMQEYLDNGVSLGWLIDRPTHQVYIYRPNNQVKCLDNPQNMSGDPVLLGFILNLAKIW